MGLNMYDESVTVNLNVIVCKRFEWEEVMYVFLALCSVWLWLVGIFRSARTGWGSGVCQSKTLLQRWVSGLFNNFFTSSQLIVIIVAGNRSFRQLLLLYLALTLPSLPYCSCLSYLHYLSVLCIFRIYPPKIYFPSLAILAYWFLPSLLLQCITLSENCPKPYLVYLILPSLPCITLLFEKITFNLTLPLLPILPSLLCITLHCQKTPYTLLYHSYLSYLC